SAGPSASVLPGELVVAAVITGGQPGYAIPGSSQRVPYVLDVRNGSASSLLEDVLSSAGGPQEGSLTLGAATSWFMVLATFRPASTPTTTTTTQPTTTTTTPLPPTTTTTSPSSTTTAPPATTSTTTSASTTTTTLPGTTTGLTSSVQPSVFGQPVTFTATVAAKSPGAGTPTGTVTFKD